MFAKSLAILFPFQSYLIKLQMFVKSRAILFRMPSLKFKVISGLSPQLLNYRYILMNVQVQMSYVKTEKGCHLS